MKLYLLLPLVLFTLAAQTAPPIAITSPAADEILRGPVTVTGTLDLPSFVSAQLDFAYASDPTGTWFTIQTFSEPVIDSALAVWDTTLITDGDYVLRLRVNFEDGTFQEVTVPVKLQNDVLPTTATPEPLTTPEGVTVFVPTSFLLAASPTPTEVPRPTPTALPSNPASLRQNEIYASLGRGALVILGLFALAGLILRVRRF
ncbi:MAG: hypothetical protein EHM33_21045 [Chloroflexi bacterium]|nr:MAG: hypothetical protein EHM33_21045 [Chloroflexota bacterium]